MKKQAYYTKPESFVRSLWQAYGEPRLRKYVESYGMKLGPWDPKGSYLDHLDEQRFRGMQSEIMESASGSDPELIKMIKGFNTMMGGTWGPEQQAQAESIRGTLAPIAPFLMRYAPEWWDRIHGSEGSTASLASAIADAHRYDESMTAEKAVEMAAEMSQMLQNSPQGAAWLSGRQLGAAYREASKRGWVGKGTDLETQTRDLGNVLKPLAAIRDTMGPMGYDTSDVPGMFAALDTIIPSTYHDFDQAAEDIRVGRWFSQRGGRFGAGMMASGQTIQPGGASMAELNVQHSQLTNQAAGSQVGNMVLATARAAEAGMLSAEGQEFLDKAMRGQIDATDVDNWRSIVGPQVTMLYTQSGENQDFLMRNPKYRPTIAAVRASQTALDHQPHFNRINRMYAGMAPEVARGAKGEYLRGRGYRGLEHYNKLQGPAVQQVQDLMGQAKNRARIESRTASLGWQGPVRRITDEVKRGTKSLPEFGAAALGGVRTPEPIKTATEKRKPTVAVDLDGTLAKPYKKFDPEVIEAPRPGAKAAMQKFRDKGYTVIINTVRGDTKLVSKWLDEHEIPYDHINENPSQPDDASEKLIADVYIDDRGVDARPAWRKIVEKVIPRLARKQEKTAVRGIPDPRYFGDLEQFGVNELIDMVVQRHKAQRAGEHFDYRIGTPKTGLLSWSMKPPRMPGPGEKRFVRQQPVHAHQYGKFQGTLGRGYGKGEVRREQSGKVLVTKASPTKIEFTVATTGVPERFVLMKPEKWGPREWLLINTTPTKPLPYKKTRYKKLRPEEVEPYIDQMQEGTSVQAKLDGAAALIKLMKGGAEILSYRVSKRTGAPIVHTEKMFGGRPQFDVPKKYEGTVLKGEMYAQKDDKVAGPQELGGILNATIEHALEKQKERGDLRSMVYDIQQLGKQPVDPDKVQYADRRKLLEEVMPFLPKDKFHISEEVTDPEKAKQLWRDIIGGRHPMTHEGVVIHPPTGSPIKAKQQEESDVHITDIFPGRGKYRGTAAGGFGYSLAAGGPRVGEVGSGLTDELRRQLYADPEAYIGRVARIRGQEQHPSGAWRTPALIALHEDYPTKVT